MSRQKSDDELRAEQKSEAGRLLDEIASKLSKFKNKNFPVGGVPVSQLEVRLEPLKNLQANQKTAAKMYLNDLKEINESLDKALKDPTFEQSQSIFVRFSKRATTYLQQRLKAENEQVSKQESEAKEVESEQVAQVDDSDDDVIILPREKDDTVEQQEEKEEESDDDVVFLDPKTGEELKAQNNDQTSAQETNIQEHDVEEEQFESENEIETDANLQEKLAAIQKIKSDQEARMKSENAPEPVENKEHNDESEQKEVEDVEVLREKLKAVQAGQSRNEALMSGVDNIDEFQEMTKKMGELQGLKSQLGETGPDVEQKEVESEGVTKATDVKEEHAAEETNEDEAEEYIIPGDDVSEDENKVEAGQNEDKGKEEIGSKQTVEPQTTNEELGATPKNNSELEKRSQSPEFADFKDFATNALREMGKEGYANDYLNRIENALVSGNVQDNQNLYTQARTLLNDAVSTKNDFDRGQKIRVFSEALKTIAQEIQSPSHTKTKSNVTQSFVSIINKADNIVTAGARVQDQIADLRRDINVIKSQPDFKQYKIERAEEKSEKIENALVEAGISSKQTQGPVNKSSEKKLDPDQKAAYQAISKLDTLLERVEKSKVGIVKSILKGQVRKHLETMNANPLKDSIQKVGGLKTEKTEEAKSTPTGFKK